MAMVATTQTPTVRPKQLSMMTSVNSRTIASDPTTKIFDDVFELCGGTAKVSVLLIRKRHYKVGPNFDAVVGIDLTKTQQVHEL
eukprot:8893966-Prorocentrum_lima.AAC.1